MATATRKTATRRAPARVTGALDEPVFQGILRAVMDRRLPPGTRLGEEVLCGIYGVSRTVVRKALQRLAQMAVVDMVPHKGASVAAPTPEETREVFEARQAIEAAIVPLAIRHARPAQLDALRVRLAAEHEALQRGDMPFGAALVKDGELLQVSGNTQCSTADGMAHAEVELLRVAQRKLGATALRGATVFASGEPCAMCCGAMFWAGISRVVFAASQADISEALGGPTLPLTSAAVFAGCQPAVQVEGPLMRDEARAVLQAFAKGHAAGH